VSDFFSSEIVRETLNELAEMQKELVRQVLYLPYMAKEQKRGHLQLMKDFLEKQKLLFFRMSLSDDPEAKETRDKILQSARMFGLLEGQGMDEFFELLQGTINKLEEGLEL